MVERTYDICNKLLHDNDSKIPFSGSNDNTIRSWDLEYNMCDKVIMGHEARINCLRMFTTNAKFKLLASASSDHTIRIWNPKNGKKVSILKGHNSEVSWLSFLSNKQINELPSSNSIVSASDDQTLRTWDIVTGNCVNTFKSVSGTALCCDSDQSLIYYGTTSGQFCAIDLKSGDEVVSIEGSTNSVYSCLKDAVQNVVYAGDHSGSIKVFDITAGKMRDEYKGHKQRVSCLQQHNNSLFSGSYDGSVIEWDLETNKAKKSFEKIAMTVHCICVTDKNLWVGYNEEVLYSWSLNS